MLGKKVEKILSAGGDWFVANFSASKSAHLTVFSVLAVAIDDSETSLKLSFTERFPDTGTILIGTEEMDYSALDRTTGILTVTRGTSPAAHSADDFVFLVVDDTVYDASDIAYFGLSAGTEIDPGRRVGDAIKSEKKEILGYKKTAKESSIAITALQSGINTLALHAGYDVNETPSNGVIEMSETELTDFAAFYITDREATGDNPNVRNIMIFPHITLGDSEKVSFNTEYSEIPFSFKVVKKSDERLFYLYEGASE